MYEDTESRTEIRLALHMYVTAVYLRTSINSDNEYQYSDDGQLVVRTGTTCRIVFHTNSSHRLERSIFMESPSLSPRSL